MQVATNPRRGFARTAETQGIILGTIIAVAVACLFSLPSLRSLRSIERLEMGALDLLFQVRPPIRESPDVVLIDIDDNSIRDIGEFPFRRPEYAHVTLALHHLGARQVVYDVQFKTQIPRSGTFDPRTGAPKLRDEDVELERAFDSAGNVVLAYNLELEELLAPDLRAKFSECRRAFEKSIAADADAVVRETGLSKSLVERELETLRREATVQLVDDALRQEPELSFEALRGRLLPDYNPSLHSGELRLLQYAYYAVRGMRLIDAKRIALKFAAVPENPMRGQGMVPPNYGFMKAALDSGFANARADVSDGIIRRPWLYGFSGPRALLYLGFEAAARALEDAEHRVEVVVDRREVRIVRVNRASGETVRTITVPTDAEGRVLVNWAGNRAHRRGSENLYFSHVPFHKFSQYYQERFEVMDGNCREFIRKLGESGAEVPADYREYLRLLDELKSSAPAPADRASKEDRVDACRRKIVSDLGDDIKVLREQRDEWVKAGRSKRMIEDITRRLEERERQHAVMAAAFEEERKLRPLVQGKICIVGSASTASGDLHPTPLDDHTPGVDVHANVVNMVLTDQFIRVSPTGLNFVYLLAFGIGVAVAVSFLSTLRSALVSGALLALHGALFYHLFVRSSLAIPGAGPAVAVIVVFACVVTYKEVITQRSKRKLHKELARQTSEEMVSIILGDPEVISRPRKMMGTIMFSDIKGFTTISEGMEPEILVGFVNRYHDQMTQIIKSHRGFVDKYIGDGIMALFGIPVLTPSHAEDACRTALLSLSALRALNERYAAEGLPQVWMRVGIHTGDVISGYIGASDRSDYTVMGDNVNLASRLEGANKEYESNIIISESTYDLVKGKFEVRELDNVRVVGRKQAVRIFELMAVTGEPLPVPAKFLEEFSAGVSAFHARSWQEAVDRFEAALALKPGDRPSMVYVSRAAGFLMSPPPDDWKGEFELLSK